MKQTIVIVGAGKGIGNHVAKKFGSHDFRVVLMARNAIRLQGYVDEFTGQQIECYGIVADALNPSSLTQAFSNVMKQFGKIDVLVYNAAILTAGRPSTLTSQDLMEHYQVDVASALHCAKLVISQQNHDGTILFTGGGLAIHPMADFTCISIDKAALRALAYALHEELQDLGIYVGIVTITGNVEEGTHFDPSLIADIYWQMYEKKDVVEVVYD